MPDNKSYFLSVRCGDWRNVINREWDRRQKGPVPAHSLTLLSQAKFKDKDLGK